MRKKLLDLQAWLVLEHPRWVLAVALLVGLLAFEPVNRLGVRTARIDLVPADDSTVVAFHAFARTFGAVHTFFLVVDGPAADARAFVDDAARELRASDVVRAVTGRLDLKLLSAQVLAAKPAAALDLLAEEMNRLFPVLNQLLKDPSPITFLSSLADELSDTEAAPPSVPVAQAALQSLEDFTLACRLALEGTGSTVLPSLDLAGPERAKAGLDRSGYLVSKDGRRLLMLISPKHVPLDPKGAGALLDRLRRSVAPALARHARVQVNFGGAAVQDSLEDATVKQDLTTTSLGASVVVLLLSILAFRNPLLGLLANAVMGYSIYLTMAVAWLLVGHLNVISGIFAAVLVGVGIDFGIYLYQLYLDAIPQHGADAMRHALLTGTPGIVTGAVTPAAAFFSLMLHRLPAFHDLGLIAGTGMLLALLGMLVVFPATIVVLKPRIQPRASYLGHLLAKSTGPGKFILPFLAVALAALFFRLPAAPFDYDISNLQAAASEANRTEAMLRTSFGLSQEFVMISSPDLKAARALSEYLHRLPAVGRVDGPEALAGVPGSRASTSVVQILELGRQLAPAAPTAVTTADPVAFLTALDKALQALPNMNRLAKLENSQALTARIHQTLELMQQLRKTCARVPPAQLRAAITLTGKLLSQEMAEFKQTLEDAESSRAVGIHALPAELATRYVGSDGSLATYVWPRADLATRETARAFVAAVEGAGRPLAGTPVMACRMLDLIQEGFYSAALLALAVIVVLVFLDFGKLVPTVLSLLPMACGTLAALAFLKLSGRSWNPVNSMALPVMLGEGVGFGVNLVHRFWRERDLAATMGGTGRAVVYAAATSITGFGSLMLAQHRGLSSFGLLLAIGTAAELLAAIVILPRVLSGLPSGDPPGHK